MNCCIHREALTAKSLPEEVCEVLAVLVRIVNFIEASALNSRLFAALCEEIGPTHKSLLFHTDVRWLPKGSVLCRVLELWDECRLFLRDHSTPGNLEQHLTDP